MAIDLDKLKTEGIVFKKGKDEDAEPTKYKASTPRKQKGRTASGASKMKAEYKARKKANGIARQKK